MGIMRNLNWGPNFREMEPGAGGGPANKEVWSARENTPPTNWLPKLL